MEEKAGAISKMKIKKLLKQIKQLNGIKITERMKREYRESPQRIALESIIIDRALNAHYKPFEKALKRAAESEIVEGIHIKRLRKLVKKLVKGEGYTTETRKDLAKTIPEIINRIERKEANQADRNFIKGELIPFVAYIKDSERTRLILERRLI